METDEVQIDELIAATRTRTVEQIRRCLVPLARHLPHAHTKLNEGVLIFRAREGRRTHIGPVWDPARRDAQMNRANLLGDPIFYGTVKTDQHEPLKTLCMEMSKQMRIQRLPYLTLTVGIWKVTTPITMFLVHRTRFGDEEPKRLEALDELERMRIEVEAQYRADVIRLQELLDREFRKPVLKGNEIEYMVSAVFGDMALRDYQGITYSSVQTAELGQNVALLPSTVETCLQPMGAYLIQFQREHDMRYQVSQYEAAEGDGNPWKWFRLQPHDRPILRG